MSKTFKFALVATLLMMGGCASFEDGNGTYKYPHDYPGAWVYQQYLPDNIKDAIYYEPKTTSRYEEALKERYDAINKVIQKYKNNN